MLRNEKRPNKAVDLDLPFVVSIAAKVLDLRSWCPRFRFSRPSVFWLDHPLQQDERSRTIHKSRWLHFGWSKCVTRSDTVARLKTHRRSCQTVFQDQGTGPDIDSKAQNVSLRLSRSDGLRQGCNWKRWLGGGSIEGAKAA